MPHGARSDTCLWRWTAVVLAVALVPVAAFAGGLAGAWTDGPNARTRLIAGTAMAGQAGLPAGQPVVGLELELAVGWKTYWRNPGDAGGVPPYITFDGSTNLKSTELLLPAPTRLADAAGEAIGYKGHVVFPIVVTPTDTNRAVTLKVRMEYGICREICIPAEATHTIELPPGATMPVPAALAAALARVPQAGPGSGRPALIASRRSGTTLEVDVHYPSGTTGADLFAEAPEGSYVPLPKRLAAPGADKLRFAITLGSEAEAAALTGKSIQLTLVGSGASSTFALVVP